MVNAREGMSLLRQAQVDGFGDPVTFHCAEGAFSMELILSEPAAAMEAPAGALLMASGYLGAFPVIPRVPEGAAEDYDEIETEDGTRYRIFDVKINQTDRIVLALTQ